MELINNTTKTLKDDLSVEIKQGSKLSIAAACFSIYAFQELKEQLSQIEQLRFIFTSPTFVTEKAKKERREFYIPRLTRERSLYGTEFEIKLRNELTQKAIARECAEWIRQKVTFKSNVSDKSIQGQIVVDSVGYTPINNFTTVELGCEKGNVISTTIVKDESLARTLLADFNEIWNDSKVLQVVTDEVIDSITAAYNENSPDFIYFVTLYNIFNEFLEDVSEDVLPNEATGFKESKIWGMLYNFQKDAALAIINKLEKFNGCILADSVGLGNALESKQAELDKMQKRIDRLMDMRMDGEITADVFMKQSTETQMKIDSLKDAIEALMPKKEDTVTNYGEKMEMLRFALSQYNAPEYFENGIPESVIDAYVEKIVVFEDHFEWYLRFGGNDPLKCRVNGKKDANPEVIFGDSPSSLTELEKHRLL